MRNVKFRMKQIQITMFRQRLVNNEVNLLLTNPMRG
jgi:hypothetical protein